MGPKSKSKKKPKQEQKTITYSQFTEKPSAKLRQNNVPIKKGKLTGDVQIAWTTSSEDEKGTVSTVWHVLKIDKEFAQKHLSGADPAVLKNAMKAAAEGKPVEEIENILIKGIVEKKPKPLPFTGKTKKGIPYLIIKIPKKEAKPIPTSKTAAEVKKMMEKYMKEKAPKKPKKPLKPIKTSETAAMVAKETKKAKEAKKPPVPPTTKPGKKPATKPKKLKEKPPKPESSLDTIVGPGEMKVAEIKGPKATKSASGKVKVEGAKEKAVVGNIEIVKPKKTTAGSVNAANKTLKSVDATFTVVGTTEEKDYNKIVNFYYKKLGKKPGAGALPKYGTLSFETSLKKSYKIFIFITTADFEKAGIKDLSNMTKNEREKAINKMTDDIFKNMLKWFGSKLPKSDHATIKKGLKDMVARIIDSIVEERSKVIELSG